MLLKNKGNHVALTERAPVVNFYHFKQSGDSQELLSCTETITYSFLLTVKRVPHLAYFQQLTKVEQIAASLRGRWTPKGYTPTYMKNQRREGKRGLVLSLFLERMKLD